MDANPTQPSDREPNSLEAPKASPTPPSKGRAVALSVAEKYTIAALTVVSSLIAFAATCFPIGSVGMLIRVQADPLSQALLIGLVGCLVGIIAAIGTGLFVAKALKKSFRYRSARTGKGDRR